MKNLLVFVIMAEFFLSCSWAQITSAPNAKSITLKKPEKITTISNSYIPTHKVVEGFNAINKSNEILNKGALKRKRFLEPEKNILELEKSKLKKQMIFSGSGSVDLRYKDTPVLSQWNGTCTAHGLSAAIENLISVNLSERHVWSKYEKYSCKKAISALSKKECITLAEAWPNTKSRPYKNYKEKKFCSYFLDKSTYLKDDIQEAIFALDKNIPIYLGTSVTKSLLNCDVSVKPTSKKTGGGHAMAIVGYELNKSVAGGGYFILKNSWGNDCGDKGYQYLSFDHCLREDLYCNFWSIDVVSK
jgi:hypothetical protein